MLADFFTKSLHGALFVKFHEVIMGWKHVDTLQTRPPSSKERVGNVAEVESNRGEVVSSVETKEENTERKKSYAEIVIHEEPLYRG